MTGALAVLAAAAVPAATVFAAPASAAQTQRVLLTATMHSCDYQPVEYAKFAGMPTPVIASVPAIIATKVKGIFFLRPP